LGSIYLAIKGLLVVSNWLCGGIIEVFFELEVVEYPLVVGKLVVSLDLIRVHEIMPIRRDRRG
jgi:hypothetical protein